MPEDRVSGISLSPNPSPQVWNVGNKSRRKPFWVQCFPGEIRALGVEVAHIALLFYRHFKSIQNKLIQESANQLAISTMSMHIGMRWFADTFKEFPLKAFESAVTQRYNSVLCGVSRKTYSFRTGNNLSPKGDVFFETSALFKHSDYFLDLWSPIKISGSFATKKNIRKVKMIKYTYSTNMKTNMTHDNKIPL